MRKLTFGAAALSFVAVLGTLVATSRDARADDPPPIAQWDATFAYIDDVPIWVQVADVAVDVVPQAVKVKRIADAGLFVFNLALDRYPAILSKYAYGDILTQNHLSGLSVAQIARLYRALERAQKAQTNQTKSDLAAYGLCPFDNDGCKAAVRAAIFASRGWTTVSN